MSNVDDNQPDANVGEDENAFSALEQQQFEAMRAGETPPENLPEGGDGDGGDGDGNTDAGKNAADGNAAGEGDDDPDVEVKDPATGKTQKRVSYHKYRRVEEKAAALQKEADEAREIARKSQEDRARIDERLKIINEALTTPGGGTEQQQAGETGAEEVPDPEKDIFGYAAYLGKQLKAANDKIDHYVSTGNQQQAEVALATTYQNDAARFAQNEPNFAAAYNYLLQQRNQELELAGMADPDARLKQIIAEEKGLVKGALDQKLSPAERIFKMAVGRGFRPAQSGQAAAGAAAAAGKETPKTQPAKDANALDADPAGKEQKAAVSVSEEIEAINRGTKAAQSLSNVGGGAPKTELTAQMLADMPEEEFNLLVETLPAHKLKELMGG